MATVEINQVAFSLICRACLRPKHRLKSLYDIGVADMFRCCTSVQVMTQDGLPSMICTQCLNQLNLAYGFRQICLQSDEILRNNASQGYLILQNNESCESEYSMEFHAPDVLEAEVILANLPEDESSINAQHNAECIMQLMSDDDDAGYLEDIGLEPECNLVENALAALEGDLQNQSPSIALWSLESENMVTKITSCSQSLVSKEKSNSENFVCDHCSETFINKSDLSVHMSIHRRSHILQCNSCLKIFPKMSKLKRHIKTHISIKEYHCKHCGKEFTEGCALAKHIIRHTSNPQNMRSCGECGKTYKFISDLKNHIRVAHTNDRPFSCAHCPSTFAMRDLLVSHVNTHMQLRHYQCKVCMKGFKYRSNLCSHMKLHTGHKPYTCDICNKGFIQSSNLKTHMRVHSGIRPYECHVCNARFTSSNARSTHVKNHKGIRPFQCLVCGKKFARSADQVLHTRIHTGEKPYSCPLCPKTFVSNSKRNKHLDTHSKTKYYNCKSCDLLFTRVRDLKEHGKIHKSKKKKILNQKSQKEILSRSFFFSDNNI